MKPKFVYGLFSLLLFSCTKEFSVKNPENNAPLLDSIVTQFNSSSVASIFSYNEDKQLSGATTYLNDTDPSATSRSQYSLSRDAVGRIISITTKDYTGAELDQTTEISIIYENSTSGRMKYAYVHYDDPNITSDSIVFSYQSKISKADYYEVGQTASAPWSSDEFTYDTKGNLTSLTQSLLDDISGILVKFSDLRFTYDNKINPLYFNEDALFFLTIHLSPCTSPNNVTQLDYRNFKNSSNNFTITKTLAYQTDGRPAQAELKISGLPTIKDIYFYRK